MNARIYPDPITYRVNGTMAETAPILAWIADQAPSARVVYPNDEYEQHYTPSSYMSFKVWFENETDEVNFKMFQSEAFEAGAQESEFQISAKPALIINGGDFITGYTSRGGK